MTNCKKIGQDDGKESIPEALWGTLVEICICLGISIGMAGAIVGAAVLLGKILASLNDFLQML